MTLLADIDSLIARGGAFTPRWGWHDDHRETDGTSAYLPALQQVRNETADLLEVLAVVLNKNRDGKIDGGACLQLGLGECDASHRAWLEVFDHVVTLDRGKTLIGNNQKPWAGVDIGSIEGIRIATRYGSPKGVAWGDNYPKPYDFLMIDAGHTAEDARRDHANYGQLVRPGGIIAFHDALRRPGFEDAVQVWRYLETLNGEVNVIGTEVGIAWLRQT